MYKQHEPLPSVRERRAREGWSAGEILNIDGVAVGALIGGLGNG